MRLRLWVVAAVIVAACAGRAEPARRPAQPEPRPTPATAPEPATSSSGRSLADVIAADMAEDNAMAWSARRPLVWNDFRAQPPDGGAESARTAHSIHYAWVCRAGGRFEFRATAAFRPNRSWVKPIVVRNPGENPRVLRHEQTHFDISEVYARRLRQEFSLLSNPCRLDDEELSALARKLLDQERAMQRRYDDETRHSLDVARQLLWEEDVRRLLAGLNRYAQ
jgi:hypothetical protein